MSTVLHDEDGCALKVHSLDHEVFITAADIDPFGTGDYVVAGPLDPGEVIGAISKESEMKVKPIPEDEGSDLLTMKRQSLVDHIQDQDRIIRKRNSEIADLNKRINELLDECSLSGELLSRITRHPLISAAENGGMEGDIDYAVEILDEYRNEHSIQEKKLEEAVKKVDAERNGEFIPRAYLHQIAATGSHRIIAVEEAETFYKPTYTEVRLGFGEKLGGEYETILRGQKFTAVGDTLEDAEFNMIHFLHEEVDRHRKSASFWSEKYARLRDEIEALIADGEDS